MSIYKLCAYEPLHVYVGVSVLQYKLNYIVHVVSHNTTSPVRYVYVYPLGKEEDWNIAIYVDFRLAKLHLIHIHHTV